MKKIVIGIDPDVTASGVGVMEDGELSLFQATLWSLFDLLIESKSVSEMNNCTLSVRLEAGWLIPGTWHDGGRAAAKKVGRNHEIGRQIEAFCKANSINVDLIKPCGYSSYTHQTFCKITNWPIKNETNKDTRVGGLLAFVGGK